MNLLGTLVAVECLHEGGETPAESPNPPPAPSNETKKEPIPVDEWLKASNTGSSSTGVAAILQNLRYLNRESDAEERLSIVTPDGRVSSQPDDWANAIHNTEPAPEPASFTFYLDASHKKLFEHGVDTSATPFVVVCPRNVPGISSKLLAPLLHEASMARAPVRIISL